MRISHLGLGLTVILAAAHAIAAERLPAFPGAEGYGRFATGGRGGDVAHVTTLDDDGPGSLRDAIRTKKADVPRTVVFDVGGTIRLKKQLRIERAAGLTLAGQTAPGGGIAIRDHGVEFRACRDLVVRHMRFRLGDEVHDVAQAHGPERIETSWWRGATVRRDYYVVETRSGARFWLFRRLKDGGWFLHGMFA